MSVQINTDILSTDKLQLYNTKQTLLERITYRFSDGNSIDSALMQIKGNGFLEDEVLYLDFISLYFTFKSTSTSQYNSINDMVSMVSIDGVKQVCFYFGGNYDYDFIKEYAIEYVYRNFCMFTTGVKTLYWYIDPKCTNSYIRRFGSCLYLLHSLQENSEIETVLLTPAQDVVRYMMTDYKRCVLPKLPKSFLPISLFKLLNTEDGKAFIDCIAPILKPVCGSDKFNKTLYTMFLKYIALKAKATSDTPAVLNMLLKTKADYKKFNDEETFKLLYYGTPYTEDSLKNYIVGSSKKRRGEFTMHVHADTVVSKAFEPYLKDKLPAALQDLLLDSGIYYNSVLQPLVRDMLSETYINKVITQPLRNIDACSLLSIKQMSYEEYATSFVNVLGEFIRAVLLIPYIREYLL